MADIRCEEASIFSREKYIPCGAPATSKVHHDRDNRSYNMCTACAEHNLRNRGGKLEFTTDEVLARRYNLTKSS